MGDFSRENYAGKNLHFGIREHAMGAITNGLALSKMSPYAATFLIFSDYLRPTLRLSSLMKIPSIFIFTHDSIAVGEDGPTHEPIEQLMSLRAIPGLQVMRPADANELTVLWRFILNLNDRPVALILPRQSIPIIDRTKYRSADGALKGAYVIAGADENPDIILISTGSEVSILPMLSSTRVLYHRYQLVHARH